MISRFLAVLLLGVAPATAQIVTEGVFVGNEQEPFVGPNFGFAACVPQRAFNARADICTPNGNGAHVTTGWGFSCSIPSYSPPYFYGSASGPTEITFDDPVTRFGGYFGTNAPIGDGTIAFYDASGALLFSSAISVPNDCQWRWLGWRVAGGAPIKRVLVTGLYSSGGYIMMDDLQVDFPAVNPVVYCTSGTSSNGCVASIGASGNPSVSYANSCVIDVADVEGQRNGTLFYGLQALPQLWCFTTGSSYLCVRVPTYRAASQASGGTAGSCDGSLSLDWNALMQSDPSALGQPWTVGAKAYVQCWYRDPLSCRFSSMSDAVELTLVP